jgi:5-methylcytosine-specific restriction protein A
MTINPLMTRERVEIGARRVLTKTEKATVWSRENGLCVLCGKPVPPAGAGVEFDHRDGHAVSGNQDLANFYAVHTGCHAKKTATIDTPRAAKTKRQEKLTRAKVSKPGGFRGWRKMNGEIVWRGKA